MGIETALTRLQECIAVATKTREEIPCPESQIDAGIQSRLAWLEGELTTRIAQLHGMSLDLECGLSLNDLGYSNDDDLNEMVEIVESDIRRLQKAIREMKGLCR